MKIIELLRKVLLPSYTDKRVDEINAENKKAFDDTAETAKRHAELLRKNGVTLRIFIAAGGDKHGH